MSWSASPVPHPQGSYIVQSGSVANTTIGVAAGATLQVPLQPTRAVPSPSVPQSACLEFQHVDERYEVHARVIETVVALVVGCLAEAVEVFADGGIGRVVLARNRVQLGGAQTGTSSVCAASNSAGLDRCVMSPGMNDECRLFRQRIHDIDCLAQC